MDKFNIDIKKFKYTDLEKCEWIYNVFNHRVTIYFTNNIETPKFSKELWISVILRRLKLKKTVMFGKPHIIKFKR